MTLATSGLTGDGVEEGIEWVADAVTRNSVVRPPHEATVASDLSVVMRNSVVRPPFYHE